MRCPLVRFSVRRILVGVVCGAGLGVLLQYAAFGGPQGPVEAANWFVGVVAFASIVAVLGGIAGGVLRASGWAMFAGGIIGAILVGVGGVVATLHIKGLIDFFVSVLHGLEDLCLELSQIASGRLTIGDDLAATIDYSVVRNAAHMEIGPGSVDLVFMRACLEPVHAMIIQKRFPVSVFHSAGERDHREAASANREFLMQLLEPGNRSKARGALRPPEMDQHDLASLIGKTEWLPVARRDREVRGLFPDLYGVNVRSLDQGAQVIETGNHP
jgi:hypothetical protein